MIPVAVAKRKPEVAQTQICAVTSISPLHHLTGRTVCPAVAWWQSGYRSFAEESGQTTYTF